MNVTTAPADGLRPSTESDSPAGEQPGDSTRRAESPDSQDPDNPPEPADADQRPSTGRLEDSARPAQSADPLVEVNDDRSAGSAVGAAWIEEHLRAATAHIDRPIARISVRLLDDAQMSELHGRATGDPDPTDVLTFESSAQGEPLEADIALCVDVAEREAGRRGHAAERELLLYALHGLLHCAGHDDHDDRAWKAMHEAEDRILETIGIGATFRGAPEHLRENDTR